MQSNLNILCLLTYTTVSLDPVLSANCIMALFMLHILYEQAELGLSSLHRVEGTFSQVTHHLAIRAGFTCKNSTNGKL